MKLTKKKSKPASSGAKYRGIIVSIVVFLLLILAILGLNLYSTFKINENEKTVNTTAQMRDLTQSVTRDLFSMKLSYGYDPRSPYNSAALARLTKDEKKFTEDLNGLDLGGVIADFSGNQIEISPLTISSERDLLRSVATEWIVFGQRVRDYIPSATDIAADSTELELAVLQAEESSIVMYNALDQLVNSVRGRAQQQSSLLRIVQIAGIIIVIIYFAIFMFYFMRKLKSADQIGVMARRETDKIMATVNEGLFLVNKDLNIGGQYSSRLESLIGQKSIANRNLENLLSSIVSMKDLETSKKFIAQLFNIKVKEKLVQDLNPLDEVRASVTEEKGNIVDRYLKFNFSRVYSADNNKIDAVLVSIADNTRAVELEKRLDHEKKHNQQQVDMLASILHTDNDSMLEFIGNTSRRLDKINTTLREPKIRQVDLRGKVNFVYREIHSLKGESSALGLDKFVQLSHEAEEQLQLLKGNSNLSGNDFLPLIISIEELMKSFDSIKEVNTMLQNRSDDVDQSSQPVEVVQETKNYQYFEKITRDIAKRENKSVRFCGFSIQACLLNGKRGAILKDIATQLIRNAVVHGIELPDQREYLGKKKKGEVKMLLMQQDKKHGLIVITDDGGGIDFDKIRQKLVAKGVCTEESAANLNEQALIKEIFKPGFSTADSVNEDAGRGVGLDIVLSSIRALDGKLSVKSEPGKFTRFSIVYSL